jgi:hypothetical protein
MLIGLLIVDIYGFLTSTKILQKWLWSNKMTNKDALEALDTLSSIAHLNLHGSVETTQFDCIDTIRQALEVNQDLVEALKDLITDGLKPCPFEWFTRRLNEIRAGSHHKGEGITFYMSPMEIERVNEAYKAWNTRANEPDTVSVEELKTKIMDYYLDCLKLQNLEYGDGVCNAIDHLRAQYPNGIKWGE